MCLTCAVTLVTKYHHPVWLMVTFICTIFLPVVVQSGWAALFVVRRILTWVFGCLLVWCGSIVQGAVQEVRSRGGRQLHELPQAHADARRHRAAPRDAGMCRLRLGMVAEFRAKVDAFLNPPRYQAGAAMEMSAPPARFQAGAAVEMSAPPAPQFAAARARVTMTGPGTTWVEAK